VRDRPIATGQVTINASPAEVYRLVSDPTVMVDFAEEVVSVRWLGKARQAGVGVKFRGSNRNGWRRWVTTCTITEAKPGQRFVYEVRTPFMVPISRWEFELAETGDGCKVTESSWLRVPNWFIPIAIFITGHPDRPGVNRNNIATTLQRLKEHVEAAVT
jgi:uncharacterized protein YndB with AHSA1/START domain